MITEEKIDGVLDWLVKHADKAAQARANRVYLEEYRKTVLAMEMKKSGESTAAAQEREALVSEAYRDHLLALQEAVKEDEFYRWKHGTAEAILDAWRSLNANARAQGKI
jgi:hypothetical protein